MPPAGGRAAGTREYKTTPAPLG